MKYLAILFLFVSIHICAQSERQISLQTHPDDRYVMKYVSGEYTLLFDYTDFLESLDESESTLLAIQTWMDGKIQSQGFFDLGDFSQKLVIDGEETLLSDIASKRNVILLINSGNMIIENTSGRSTVSSLKVHTAPRGENDPNNITGHRTFTDQATGKVVFVNEIYRRRGCYSF